MRLVVIVMLAACSVDRSALEDRVFECASDGDCAIDYVCQAVDATGVGFCAPRADPDECAGVSTEDEACLAECSVESQESAMTCVEGMECQRTDMLGEAGVCLATQTCSADSDCTEGENARCLSGYVLDEPNPFTIDHLSCVRGDCDPDANGQDDEGVCLENEVCVGASWTGFWGALVKSVCLPRCGDRGDCPPGFGCYAVNGEDFGPCVPGLPGMTCHEDLDCLAGTCEEMNGEMRCLVPCEVGDTVVCSDEPVSTDGPALQRLVCVGGACLVRDYLAPCEFAAACGPGFDCSMVDIGPETTPNPWKGCVLACNPFAPDACPPDAFCGSVNTRPVIDEYGCWRKLPDGFRCLSHDACASGFCDPEATCEQERGCCAPSE